MSAVPLALALRLARRELRGGLRAFRLLVVCLALGVGAIAAAGSLRAAVEAGLAGQARALVGGDLALSQPSVPPEPAQRAFLDRLGRVGAVTELRGMVLHGDDRLLVEVKAVDPAYPLVGAVALAPDQSLAGALERRDGVWGAVAEPALLARLGLSPGDRIGLGDATLELRAALTREPDRLAAAIGFGPRLMIAEAALADTGLLRPGSLTRHSLRLVLPEGASPAEARAAIAAAFPQAAWQVRDTAEPAPGLGRFLDSVAAFLTLVGLGALLIGGIGVANATRAYLDGRVATIATLKCLGAPAGLILATYLCLIGALAGLGILLGLAAGALTVPAFAALAIDALPLPPGGGFYPAPLALAAGFGALAALAFTLGPLGRARRIPALALVRLHAVPDGDERRRPDRATLAAVALAAAALAGLAIATSPTRGLAAGFVAACCVLLVLLRGLAWGLARLAARLNRRPRRWLGPPARLALAALARPGSALPGMMLSLGLGLALLATLALVEANLGEAFGRRLPDTAPGWFFIDLQPSQVAPLRALVAGIDPTARLDTAPMVRGRIAAIKGVPVESAAIAPDAAWAARGDRGLSIAATPPAGSRIVAGRWWPEDYAGPPLVSLDRTVAKGFGVGIGDHLTLNVLGREIEVEIASLREIDWASLSMNFAILLSPGSLDGAPYSVIATLRAADAPALAIERAATARFPSLSAIRVREAIETARGVIDRADQAVRATALLTLAAGILVLAAAVTAGARRRGWEAVLLKSLGASRAQIRRATLIEFGLIGLAAAFAATLVGEAAAWALLTLVMKLPWSPLPLHALIPVGAGLGATLVAGLAASRHALAQPAARLLREE
ncbi:ABC transporter permease [Phaeospirillum tilakii]|uniref:ABC transporter permease n=1 Tax=Phaeospirillum tilakii TaxID=741673 RepID=A0ABW5CED8_9PROT